MPPKSANTGGKAGAQGKGNKGASGQKPNWNSDAKNKTSKTSSYRQSSNPSLPTGRMSGFAPSSSLSSTSVFSTGGGKSGLSKSSVTTSSVQHKTQPPQSKDGGNKPNLPPAKGRKSLPASSQPPSVPTRPLNSPSRGSAASDAISDIESIRSEMQKSTAAHSPAPPSNCERPSLTDVGKFPIILMKSCENKQCRAKSRNLRQRSDVVDIVRDIYSQNEIASNPTAQINEDAYQDTARSRTAQITDMAIPPSAFLRGKQLVDELITKEEKDSYGEEEEVKVLEELERDLGRQELVEMLAEKYSFYSKINAEALAKAHQVIHSDTSMIQLEHLLTEVNDGNQILLERNIAEVYKILREIRPYIYKAVNNIEAMQLYEKNTVYFTASSIEEPTSATDVALLGKLRTKAADKELNSTRSCLETAEGLVAVLKLFQIGNKYFPKSNCCKGQEITNLNRDLEVLEKSAGAAIDHLACFPDHIETLVYSMGDIPTKSSDKLIPDRTHCNNFSNISGREYNYLITQERKEDYKRCGAERKHGLKILSERIGDRRNTAEARKAVTDSIIQQR